MSELLPTTCGKKIGSIAYNGRYHLCVKKGEKIIEESYSMEDYGSLIKKLWEDYLKGEESKLLGCALSNEGLVIETIHYLGPNIFSAIDGPVLDKNRESVLYWLKSQYQNIQARIGDNFNFLNRELNGILQTHLERKKAR